MLEGLIKLLMQAVHGEKLVDVPLGTSTEAASGARLVSIAPALDPSGQVDTLIVITRDTQAPHADVRFARGM